MAASQTLRQTEVKAHFEKLYLQIVADTPTAASDRIAEEAKLFADIAKQIGLTPK